MKRLLTRKRNLQKRIALHTKRVRLIEEIDAACKDHASRAKLRADLAKATDELLRLEAQCK